MGKRGSSSGFNGGQTPGAPETKGAEPKGEVFASFPPSKLHPDGEPIVTKHGDEYHYERTMPVQDVDDATLDYESADYKQALREFNARVSLRKDGSIEAKAGPLFPRTRVFKTPEAFAAEAEKRIQVIRRRYEQEAERLKAGRLTQIEAESIKTTARKMSKSMAISRINRDLRERALSYRYSIEAAARALGKIQQVVDRAHAYARYNGKE